MRLGELLFYERRGFCLLGGDSAPDRARVNAPVELMIGGDYRRFHFVREVYVPC